MEDLPVPVDDGLVTKPYIDDVSVERNYFDLRCDIANYLQNIATNFSRLSTNDKFDFYSKKQFLDISFLFRDIAFELKKV